MVNQKERWQYPKRLTQSGTDPQFVKQHSKIWNSCPKSGTGPLSRFQLLTNCGTGGKIEHSKFVGTLSSSDNIS